MFALSADRFTKNKVPRSCEPCRKAKVRCDHARPHCGRCISRNIVVRCIYQPASSNRIYTASLDSPPIFPGPSSSTPRQGGRQYLRNEEANPGATNNEESVPQSVKFLGTTSFSAVFDEHRLSNSGSWINPENGVTAFQRTTQIGNSLIGSGAQLLLMLSRIQNTGDIVEYYYRSSQFPKISLPILKSSLESIDTMRSIQLANETQRLKLSEQIFSTTSMPMANLRDVEAQHYHNLFTGPELRWEIVGIVFTLIGLSLVVLKDDKTISGNLSSLQDHGYSAADMLRASNLCIYLCEKTENLNDLTIWLLLKNLVLQMLHHGDSNHSVWRRLGDLSTAIFAIGFHQDSVLQKDAPLFLVQSRRSCFAGSYYIDKAVATFLGRPPRLPVHYCEYELPFDLTDEDSMEDCNLSLNAVNKLDNFGWNTSGEIHSSTWTRVRFMIARIREDVLDVSHASTSSDIDERVKIILERSRRMWDALPAFLRHESKRWDRGSPSIQRYKLMIIYLDHRYSEYLLYRAVTRRTATSYDMLCSTARDILANVIALVGQRVHVAEMSRDFAWVVLFYGLSSAAFLAVELLEKQQQKIVSSALPRSDIIQDLTILMASLQWVAQPGEGNYDTCRAAQCMLKQRLDALLNWQPPTPVSNAQSEEAVLPLPGQDFPLQDLIFNESFDEFLNVTDWDSTFWSFAL